MTEHTEAFLAQYPEYYGRNYNHRKPDFNRCAEGIFRNFSTNQCQRKNGHGPHGAWCKQHDPIAVKAKDDAYMKKREAEWKKKSAIVNATRELEPALRKIAEGHNDPRDLAKEVIDALDKARNMP